MIKQPLISARDLSVAYDGKEALSCASLDINAGDFIAVTGPNGGGKTTLVKAILGIIPYRGAITYSPEAKRRVGYLPQVNSSDRSFPITMFEAVLSGLQSEKKLFGRYTGQDRAKVAGLLELTGIKHLSHKPVGELSGGEFQRAMLCRAIISDPVLLILDEPANFVDNKFEDELYTMLRGLNGRMAILMVTHDIEAASPYVKSALHVDRTVRAIEITHR